MPPVPTEIGKLFRPPLLRHADRRQLDRSGPGSAARPVAAGRHAVRSPAQAGGRPQTDNSPPVRSAGRPRSRGSRSRAVPPCAAGLWLSNASRRNARVQPDATEFTSAEFHPPAWKRDRPKIIRRPAASGGGGRVFCVRFFGGQDGEAPPGVTPGASSFFSRRQ